MKKKSHMSFSTAFKADKLPNLLRFRKHLHLEYAAYPNKLPAAKTCSGHKSRIVTSAA